MITPVATSAGDTKLGLAGSTGFIAVTAGMIVAGAVALGFARFFAGTPVVEQNLEAAVASLAFAAVVAAPGVLALLALADRPVLLLPAGIMLVPLSFLSFAGVTLPLLVPAVMLFTAYGRRSAALPSRRGQSSVTTLVTVVLLLVAGLVLFVHQDPRSYTTPTSGGSVSDVVTYAESATSLAVVAVAVGWAWVASAPAPTATNNVSEVGRHRIPLGEK